MLPANELRMLLATVTGAAREAARGDAARGYEALLAGLRRAEATAAQDESDASELVAHWRQALDHYAARHQVGRA